MIRVVEEQVWRCHLYYHNTVNSLHSPLLHVDCCCHNVIISRGEQYEGQSDRKH